MDVIPDGVVAALIAEAAALDAAHPLVRSSEIVSQTRSRSLTPRTAHGICGKSNLRAAPARHPPRRGLFWPARSGQSRRRCPSSHSGVSTMMAEELIVGARAIGAFVGLRPRLVYSLVEEGRIPVFRLGKRIVAAPSALYAWKQRRVDEAERRVAL